jgi:hypothetical protein
VFKLVEFTETDGIVGKLELTAVWTILGFIWFKGIIGIVELTCKEDVRDIWFQPIKIYCAWLVSTIK